MKAILYSSANNLRIEAESDNFYFGSSQRVVTVADGECIKHKLPHRIKEDQPVLIPFQVHLHRVQNLEVMCDRLTLVSGSKVTNVVCAADGSLVKTNISWSDQVEQQAGMAPSQN